MNAKNRNPQAAANPICEEIIKAEGTFDYGYIAKILDGYKVVKNRAGRGPKKKERFDYLSIVCAFDIETTNIQTGEHTERVHKKNVLVADFNAAMYIWQFQLGTHCTIIGRTWEEYKHLISLFEKYFEDTKTKLVVYVHNLSFEFQFLAGVFDFQREDVFALKPRKVLTVDHGPIEYRCSYIHSNKTLAKFTETFNCAHAKAVGFLDYKKPHYPWTELTPDEITYCVNDVRGLVEAIITEMQLDGDTLKTIPLTSTGYVRRDAKKVMFKYGIRKIKALMPDFELYTALREAFRGGDTHANRYYSGVLLHNVKSADMSSAYPGVQCTCDFPVTPFRKELPDAATLRRLLKFKKACLFRVAFFNIRQKNINWGFPYLSISKCRNMSHWINDNGRVIEAQYLETTITDIDFGIILNEYDFDGLNVIDLWSSSYGLLPVPFRKLIIEYFERKTKLKGVDDMEYEYMKSKNKLNSLYGMSAQDPLKLECIFNNGFWDIESCNLEELYQEQINHAFLPYQWGVWTTCHTRRRLKIAQRAAGAGGVYCDTDSIKYVGDCALDEYNTDVHYTSNDRKAYATDPAGHVHYMGVYEDERPYKEFITWGAKKYCYSYTGEDIHTTIAGVSKSKGPAELKAAGGLAAFKPGFVFKDAAGKLLVYNDEPELDPIVIDGHILDITRNVCILDNTYTVGITHEYAKLIGIEILEV